MRSVSNYFGSKDQHYKIEGLDLISRELKYRYLNNGKTQARLILQSEI